MTERERWTVYPLLFLSLGIGLRSHITSSLELNDISCNTLKSRMVQITGGDDHVRLALSADSEAAGGGGTLTIFSEEGQPEVMMRALPQGGVVEVASAGGGGVVKILCEEGKPVIGLRGGPQGGVIELASAKGARQVVLAVAPPGGIVQTFDAQGKMVRTLAVGIEPGMLLKFGPPPAPPADERPKESAPKPGEEPSGEKADPKAGKPADPETSAEQTSEAKSKTKDEPAGR